MAQRAVQGREYRGVSIPPVGMYELDRTHTVVGFVARHMLSKVRGQFTEFTGTIEVGDSPEDSRVEVEEGHGDTEFRSVLFWVNLARKDKNVEPSALVVQPDEIPTLRDGDAIVRVLVGEGSPVQLGTPALILDVELPEGGTVTTPVPREFQGFAYLLEGEGAFGANLRPARPPQLVVLGPGKAFTVTDAVPGTRYMLMAGQPYGEAPVFNGPFVDSTATRE